MAQIDRLTRLKSQLQSGRCLDRQSLLDDFEISPATLKRDLALLRDRLNAPIVWDRERGGYRLDLAEPTVGPQYELPGLWLSAEEIHALLTMQHLLGNLDAGGLLGSRVAPLMKRLSALLGTGTHTSAEVVRRIRVQTVGARKVDVPHFQAVGSALLRRRRLVIDYHGRGRNVRQEREVSPQRLIHYRDNWYLDAWCHLRDGLRSFAVDAIVAARVLDRGAIDVADAELDELLGAGYGIFAGREVQRARLRFAHRVPMLMREYGLDLQARLAAVDAGDDDTVSDALLETLAFAEGRLLSIHPFADFNGRTTRLFLRLLMRRLDLRKSTSPPTRASRALSPGPAGGEWAGLAKPLRRLARALRERRP